MNAGRSYIRPVEIGEVMRAGVVARVLDSRSGRFPVGTVVSAMTDGLAGVWELVSEETVLTGTGKLVVEITGPASP